MCLHKPNSLLEKKWTGNREWICWLSNRPNNKARRKQENTLRSFSRLTGALWNYSHFIYVLVFKSQNVLDQLWRDGYIYVVAGRTRSLKIESRRPIFHPTWMKLYWRLSDLLDRQPHRHVHIHTKPYSAYFSAYYWDLGHTRSQRTCCCSEQARAGKRIRPGWARIWL